MNSTFMRNLIHFFHVKFLKQVILKKINVRLSLSLIHVCYCIRIFCDLSVVGHFHVFEGQLQITSSRCVFFFLNLYYFMSQVMVEKEETSATLSFKDVKYLSASSSLFSKNTCKKLELTNFKTESRLITDIKEVLCQRE